VDSITTLSKNRIFSPKIHNEERFRKTKKKKKEKD
jgi:hypothetical protein